MIDDRDPLTTERDFLLRSLDDLEDERAAGNIDDGTYRTLHDDYTARAASVLRTIEDGVDRAPPKPPPAPGWMRAATIGGIVVFAIVAAVLLARTVGERKAGDTITGRTTGAARTATDDAGAALAAAVKADPASYDARLAYARFLMQENDLVQAVQQFGAASQIDPTQPEPLAYTGWIQALAADQAKDASDRAALLEQALDHFGRAIAADPDYADTYVFQGLTYLNVADDPARAVPALQKFLVLAPPDHPMREAVLDVLARAVNSTDTSRP